MEQAWSGNKIMTAKICEANRFIYITSRKASRVRANYCRSRFRVRKRGDTIVRGEYEKWKREVVTAAALPLRLKVFLLRHIQAA